MDSSVYEPNKVAANGQHQVKFPLDLSNSGSVSGFLGWISTRSVAFQNGHFFVLVFSIIAFYSRRQYEGFLCFN
jgi:hypothetical protein